MSVKRLIYSCIYKQLRTDSKCTTKEFYPEKDISKSNSRNPAHSPAHIFYQVFLKLCVSMFRSDFYVMLFYISVGELKATILFYKSYLNWDSRPCYFSFICVLLNKYIFKIKVSPSLLPFPQNYLKLLCCFRLQIQYRQFIKYSITVFIFLIN